MNAGKYEVALPDEFGVYPFHANPLQVCAPAAPDQVRRQRRTVERRLAIHHFHMGLGASALCSSTDRPLSDFAQSVKQQADIVKVIEGYIRLRGAGAQRFKGLCPFHKEKTPSFNVNAGSQQFFYCFGCQATGDVFTFVGRMENVTFPEAVRIVAQKCGIPLPKREFASPEEAAEARMRTKLFDLHEVATAWFEEQLRGPEGALAREYLAGRGLTDEGIRKFRIGYALDSFGALRDRLSGMADEATLRASGLFSSKEQGDGNQGPIYDRFRKRVTFPISNEGGRVIAFTARVLETGEKAGAKYINSPETPLYSKGQVLFNLDKAKTAIRAVEFALLVEGQMDCISVYLAGIQNVIATSGTAFTEHQVMVLKRHTPNVIVNFDPDTAGANAAEKSISLLTEEGFTIKIVTLDGGLDPDRFVRERGVEAYKEALRGARRQSDYLIERARASFPGANAEQKVKAMNFLLPHIRRMPETLTREQFAADAAQKLGIDSAVLREELRQAAMKRRERVEERPAKLTEVERALLRALAITDPDGEPVRRLAVDAVLEQPAWFEHLSACQALQLLAGREARDPMEVVDDPAQRALLAEALLGENKPPEPEEVASALQEVQERAIEGQQRNLRAEIAVAEGKGDFGGLALLTQKKLDLDRKLRQLHSQEAPERWGLQT
jgi:DNA primase